LLFPTQVARAEILGIGGDTVSLQAEHLDVDIMTGEATLTGSVTLTKGDVTVSCPRIDVHFDQTPRVTWAAGQVALPQMFEECTRSPLRSRWTWFGRCWISGVASNWHAAKAG